MTRYYLDTSIWLDLFEDRNEPNLPKGIFAKKFMELMITAEEELIYSDIVDIELKRQGYSQDELYYLIANLVNYGTFARFSRLRAEGCYLSGNIR